MAIQEMLITAKIILIIDISNEACESLHNFLNIDAMCKGIS